MMAATGLRSKENHGPTGAEDLQNITKDHLVEHSGVTNTEVTSSTLVRQNLPQLSVEGQRTADFFARSHSNVGKPPLTAQLTLFYAGVVNVYDDVPLDKAEAIMILAGRARTCGASSSDTNVLSECGVPASIAMKQVKQLESRAQSPSQLTAKPECVSNVQRLKTIATKAELPQARKASLARFLERRKDRSRAGPYTATTRSNCTAPSSSWLSPQTSSALSSPSRRN
nr:putative jasmonate ZIM domain protein 2 [Calohypnum plumiforme]